MSVSELFYQSALINALVFLWIASAVSAVRMLLAHEKKVSTAFFWGLCFGPLALIGAWLFTSQPFVPQVMKSRYYKRSIVGVVSVTLAIAISFYVIFISGYLTLATEGELLLRTIAFFVVGAGFLSGIFLSALTLRVAFFESCWLVFLFSFLALTLQNWADKAFSYGTSLAYFSTLLLTASGLLLVFLTLGGSVGYLIFGEGRCNVRFSYEYFIGTRFLMTKRSSQVVSLISVISVIAVMIACAGMIIVMSVMNGFSSDLRSKILGANAHLMVLKYGKDFAEYDEIIKKTKDIEGVKEASAFIVNEGMVSSNRNLSGSIITGIDIDRVINSSRLKYVNEKSIAYLREPKKIPVAMQYDSNTGLDALKDNAKPSINELPGVIIGREMATDLQVLVGDIVNLISPVGDIGPTGPIPKAKPFRVAGLFYSGMYDFDSKFAYITLSDAQDFFNLGNSVTGVEYRVNDIEQTRAVAKEIDRLVGGYPFYIRDWMQMNRNMFSALQLEKIAMLIILGTLIFMASLLILVTLIMMVMEKGKEIAILKSMGATDVSVMKIFVTYGLFVGGLGALLGGFLGVLVCFLIEKIGIRLDPDIYYFSNLPVKIIAEEVFLVISAAILISFLATIPPSLFAARLKPVEGLRYE